MKKLLINIGFLILMSSVSLISASTASASGLSQLMGWFKTPTLQEKTEETVADINIKPIHSEHTNIVEKPLTMKTPKLGWIEGDVLLPPAQSGVSYSHQIKLTDFIKTEIDPNQLIFILDKKHPNWLQLSVDQQSLEGNQQLVHEKTDTIEFEVLVKNKLTGQSAGRKIFKISISHQNTAPQWNISSFPAVSIVQRDYPDINLNEYVTSNVNQDSFLYSLTPGKPNPNWVHLQPNGQLHIATDKISLEDIDTTQIIYLSVTSSRSAHSSDAEITIQITPNQKLSAPEWQASTALKDGVPSRPYFINLASILKTDNLLNDDQISFQILNSSADWLQIGENGFSLIAKNIPENAANKYYEVILRATSRMSGKFNDLNAKIYVNPVPQAFVWKNLKTATINQSYSLDLADYLQESNIHHDKIHFEIDLATLPYWLSVENQHILTGTPLEAGLLSKQQSVTITAISEVTGISTKATFVIPIFPDPKLQPQWKKNFLPNPVVDEAYRSDDLTTILENTYPHDEFSFEYVSGPEWLGLNSLCHCLASKGDVPSNAAGKNFTINLRVYSRASAKVIEYSQKLVAYTGAPHWTQTKLPDVKIAQSGKIEIPMNQYVQNDISGDQFTYQLDRFHSPRWVRLGKDSLIVNTDEITPNEVGTVQSVRLIATSQNTQKTSVQLLTVNVLPNPDLPKPLWSHSPLAITTAGVTHAMDLNEYVKNKVANDHLTFRLAQGSPAWLSIKENRLTGTPPVDQVGGTYPVALIVHSQASGADSLVCLHVAVQLKVVAGDNMEIHPFYDNHQSIVIRGLQKNHKYHLAEVKGSHFDFGPFYSPRVIKTDEDWNNNPFYTIGDDKVIETGDDGVVSIVYYSTPSNPAPKFDSVILR